MDIQNMDFLESKTLFWRLYFDGASNATGAGAGAVLVSITGQQFPVAAKLGFCNSNNTAEYEACILGLELAINMRIKRLTVYGDSELVIKQANGDYSIREYRLMPYHDHVRKLIQKFEEVTFLHTPRDKNDFADALATIASLIFVSKASLVPPITIELKEKPAYYFQINDVDVFEDRTWLTDMKRYLRD
jgi:ribonuclease HI